MPTLAFGQKANPKTVVASFGGECEGTKYRFSTRLKNLIQKFRQESGNPCDSIFCESAFAYDLNGDGRKEYFVRLSCGATGNCTWGIFSDGSAKLRGIFTAWFFFIHNGQVRGVKSVHTHARAETTALSLFYHIAERDTFRPQSAQNGIVQARNRFMCVWDCQSVRDNEQTAQQIV